MAYPPEIKNRALELFIELKHIPDVYKQLKQEYKGKNIPKAITVRKWIENSKLSEVKKSLDTDVLVHARTKEIEDTIQRQEIHKEKYRKLIDKASETLFGKESKNFHTASDAAKAMDMGIKGESGILSQQVNKHFAMDLLEALAFLFKDDESRREGAMAVQRVLAKYSDNQF